jgi:hypothetical protein
LSFFDPNYEATQQQITRLLKIETMIKREDQQY